MRYTLDLSRYAQHKELYVPTIVIESPYFPTYQQVYRQRNKSKGVCEELVYLATPPLLEVLKSQWWRYSKRSHRLGRCKVVTCDAEATQLSYGREHNLFHVQIWDSRTGWHVHTNLSHIDDGYIGASWEGLTQTEALEIRDSLMAWNDSNQIWGLSSFKNHVNILAGELTEI